MPRVRNRNLRDEIRKVGDQVEALRGDRRCAAEKAMIELLEGQIITLEGMLDQVEVKNAALEVRHETDTAALALLRAEVEDLKAALADCEGDVEPPIDPPPIDPPPVPEEVFGFGANLKIPGSAEVMMLEEPTYENLAAILLSEKPRHLVIPADMTGMIPLGEPIVLNSAHSGLRVGRWPKGLATFNGGTGQVDMIEFGAEKAVGGSQEAAIVRNVHVEEWRAYGGASTAMDSSRFADNFAFTAVEDSVFERILSIGGIDKISAGKRCRNVTFNLCGFGAGLAEPDPPHNKLTPPNTQPPGWTHNRTWSMFCENVTVAWSFLGLDDYRILANCRGGAGKAMWGPVDFYGCVAALSGSAAMNVGRNKTQRGGWLPGGIKVNLRRIKWIVLDECTAKQLIDVEAQTGFPGDPGFGLAPGATGCASVHYGSSNEIDDPRGVVKSIGSPTMDTAGLWASAPHEAPTVPDSGQDVEQFVLSNFGPLDRCEYQDAIERLVRERTGRQVRKAIAELLG